MINKTLYFNGKVYLKDEFAIAFEVDENGRFQKIFKNKNEYNLSDYQNKCDLENKTVIPSFIDTHNHFLLTARNINNLNFDTINNKEELVSRLREYVQFYDQANEICLDGYKTQKFGAIDRHFLDSITKNKTLFIYEYDNHSCYLNTLALKKLGLFQKNMISDKGCIVELDETFFPNGVLREKALNLVRQYFYRKDTSKDIKKLTILQDKLISYGISTISTCDLIDINFDAEAEVYKGFESERILNIIHQCPVTDLSNCKNFLKKIENTSFIGKDFQIKLFIDGSINSKTAAISDYYIDSSENMGLLNYDYVILKQLVSKINKLNVQVVAHCIGDRASFLCTKVFNDIDEKNKMRNTIVHCQITTNKLIDLMCKANVYVSANPCFIEDDLNVLDKYIPDQLLKSSYAYKTMYDKNVIVSFGTDSPICDYNPWTNIYYAIANKQLSKTAKEWNQKENFTIEEAIDCYTEKAALTIFKEDKLGKIKEGYDANFLVLNQDIFNLKDKKEIINTKVLKHFKEGKLISKD